MLKRYWLVIYPENKYGPGNLGVTAFSVAEAKGLSLEELQKLGWDHISSQIINNAEAIENIDVRELDQNHVIPNIGVVSGEVFGFQTVILSLCHCNMAFKVIHSS